MRNAADRVPAVALGIDPEPVDVIEWAHLVVRTAAEQEGLELPPLAPPIDEELTA